MAPADAVRDLLQQAGLGADFRADAVAGGGNNRVFRLETNRGEIAALKVYFRHASDSRDRLGAEFGFARFAWDLGLRCLPEPLGADGDHGLGLYEFVRGVRLQPGAAAAEHVTAGLDFYRGLQAGRDAPEAAGLPVGAEACFSLAEHLACVDRRLTRLAGLPDAGSAALGRRFVETELRPRWNAVRAGIERAANAAGRSLDEPLPAADRCLSPSDFGFHNALIDPAGTVRFLDFEYAGWDDPAKVVCDFFCQPAVPVPDTFFDMFAAGVVAGTTEPDRHRQRIDWLLPVYRLKWCCILLNQLLPDGNRRRTFAGQGGDAAATARRQIEKARALLQTVKVPAAAPRVAASS